MNSQIQKKLDGYASTLRQMILESNLDRIKLLILFKTFYADCLWWPPALQQMSKKAKNTRLKRALHENYLCETGQDGGIAHTKLMQEFVDSIGMEISMDDMLYAKAIRRASGENNMLKKASEAKIAGFMLATETLFPLMLVEVRPHVLNVFPNINIHYIDEHIEVDSDHHAIWMAESVEEILSKDPNMMDEILSGMQEGMHGATFPFELMNVSLKELELSVN